MSWDIQLKAPCCGAFTECLDLTYNLGVMLKEGNVHPNELRGKKAEDIIPMLTDAIKAMYCDPVRFKVHNPPNGWGDYDGCIEFLERLLSVCLKNPTYIVEIS